LRKSNAKIQQFFIFSKSEKKKIAFSKKTTIFAETKTIFLIDH